MDDLTTASPVLVRIIYPAPSSSPSANALCCDAEDIFCESNSTAVLDSTPDSIDYGAAIAAGELVSGNDTREKLCAGSVERELNVITGSQEEEEPLVFPKVVAWDWPFTGDGMARGVYQEGKFSIHLPFSGGGGEARLRTLMKKFSKISESNFCWTIGLSSSSGAEGGSGFWRMELEVVRNLNCLVLLISRDISRGAEKQSKKLKLVRKVYRFPNYYDVRTLTSTSNDWSILIEVQKREETKSRGRGHRIRRHNTATE